jgi:hypothetical protein
VRRAIAERARIPSQILNSLCIYDIPASFVAICSLKRPCLRKNLRKHTPAHDKVRSTIPKRARVPSQILNSLRVCHIPALFGASGAGRQLRGSYQAPTGFAGRGVKS